MTRRTIAALALRLSGSLLAAAPLGHARAETRLLPVAHLTIYPGDRITDALLEERPFTIDAVPIGAAVETRERLVGKVALRTLLPGRPITAQAVANPKLVAIGASVKIVFAEGGLEITASGRALQAGAVGDRILVRNEDSGVTVSGRVLADGSVKVSEG